MGTANYNFTYLVGTNKIDLVGDTTTFLDEIDTTIHNLEINGGYVLPIASSSALGGIKTGTSGSTTAYVNVTSDGKAYVPVMSSSNMGTGKPDNTTIKSSQGTLTVVTASDTTAGIVQPDGSTITISDGVISAVDNTAALDTRLTAAEGNITTLQTNVSTLTNSVNTNTDNITSLTTTVNAIKAITDKITSATTYADLASHGFTYLATSA